MKASGLTWTLHNTVSLLSQLQASLMWHTQNVERSKKKRKWVNKFHESAAGMQYSIYNNTLINIRAHIKFKQISALTRIALCQSNAQVPLNVTVHLHPSKGWVGKPDFFNPVLWVKSMQKQWVKGGYCCPLLSQTDYIIYTTQHFHLTQWAKTCGTPSGKFLTKCLLTKTAIILIIIMEICKVC